MPDALDYKIGAHRIQVAALLRFQVFPQAADISQYLVKRGVVVLCMMRN